MDFGKLFFSAYGRIGRQEFWVGWAILLMVGIFCAFIPLINLIAPWALLYCGVCIRSKRLHDMNRSGWWQLIPHIAWLVVLVIAIYMVAGAVITGVVWDLKVERAAVAALVAGGLTLVMTMLVAGLIDLGFLLWIGVAERDPYENIHGPGPSDADCRVGALA